MVAVPLVGICVDDQNVRREDLFRPQDFHGHRHIVEHTVAEAAVGEGRGECLPREVGGPPILKSRAGGGDGAGGFENGALEEAWVRGQAKTIAGVAAEAGRPALGGVSAHPPQVSGLVRTAHFGKRDDGGARGPPRSRPKAHAPAETSPWGRDAPPAGVRSSPDHRSSAFSRLPTTVPPEERKCKKTASKRFFGGFVGKHLPRHENSISARCGLLRLRFAERLE